MSRLTYGIEWDELKGDWPAWLLIVVSFAVAIWAFPNLPDRVPMHWLLRGGAGRYTSPSVAAFFPPVLHLGIYVMLLIAPLIDPRRESNVRVIRFYRGLRQLVIAVVSLVYFFFIYAALAS